MPELSFDKRLADLLKKLKLNWRKPPKPVPKPPKEVK